MADEMPTLMLYGVCGTDFFEDGYTAKGVADWLGKNASAPEIQVRISSGGGFVDDGMAIYNLLAEFPGRKVMRVDSVAASMAAVIFMAGDERIMGEGTLLMVHNPWTGIEGNAAALRKEADTLDKFAEQHRNVFVRKTDKAEADVQAWFDAETWFDAAAAIEQGLATAVAEVDKAAVEARLGAVRLDFLSLSKPLPDRVTQAQAARFRAALTGLNASFAALTSRSADLAAPPGAVAALQSSSGATAPEGKAAPDAAAEVRLGTPMTTEGTSAATPAETVEKIDQAAIAADAVKAERTRAAEIRRIVAAVKLPAELADRLVNDGKTVEDARVAVIDAMAEAQAKEQPAGRPHAEVIPGKDETEKWQQGAQEWILVKAGLAPMMAKAAGQKLNPGEFRGMTMLDLAKEAMTRNGAAVRGMDKRDVVGRAFTMRGQSPGNSTSDFSVLLENTMHKVLQAAYATQPDTWSRWCATGSVSDFRAHNRYRKGSFGTLDTVGETGEFKRKQIPDGEKGVITASTKGNIIAITRQAIINDDLSAFNDLAVMFGRAARLSIEVDVYAALTSNAAAGPTLQDGNALFHAAHNNIAGTNAAPSVDAFDAARVLMAQQRDVSANEYLDLRPAVWVGPITYGGSVRVLNGDQYDPDATNKLQKTNRVRGLLTDIVDTPRLSGTRWYMFADPSVAPVMEVAFLDGVQEPFVDTMDGWTIDGTEMKVRLDYGVAAVDYRGGMTNVGA